MRIIVIRTIVDTKHQAKYLDLKVRLGKLNDCFFLPKIPRSVNQMF